MRPLSHHGEKQFVAGHTDRQNFGFEANTEDNKMTSAGWPDAHINGWFQDVIELRKKAGEYKCRGWGAEMQPEMLSKQKELWDQVSRRSSLSALSLASATARYVRSPSYWAVRQAVTPMCVVVRTRVGQSPRRRRRWRTTRRAHRRKPVKCTLWATTSCATT